MAIRRSRNQHISSGHNKLSASVKVLPTVMAMRTCFERYLDLTIADGNASDDTIKSYRSRLAQFLNWCHARELYPALINKTNILQYRKHLINSSHASSTIRSSLTAVRHFYTACLEDALVKENPAIGVKAPKEKRELNSTTNYLSEFQLQQLFNCIAPNVKNRGNKASQVQVLRDRLLLGCMALQGCRTVEMHRASFNDVYFSDGCMYLRLDGKNSIRTVILRPDLAALMVDYQQALKALGVKLIKSAPLFISLSNRHYGSRLSRRGIAYLVDNYLKKCDLKYGDFEKSISAHSLRHTAGTLSLHNGSSLLEVQQLLGHGDPKTTTVYIHTSQAAVNNPASRINIVLEPNFEHSFEQHD